MGERAINRRSISLSHGESVSSNNIKKNPKDLVKIFGKVTEYGGISLVVVAAVLALALAIFSGLFMPATFIAIGACSVLIPAFFAALSLIVSRILRLPCLQKDKNEGIENSANLKKEGKTTSGNTERSSTEAKQTIENTDALEKENKQLLDQVELLNKQLKETAEKYVEEMHSVNVELEEHKSRAKVLELRLQATSKGMSSSASPGSFRRNEEGVGDSQRPEPFAYVGKGEKGLGESN